MIAMLPVFLYAAVSSAAVALLSPLWLAILLFQQWWPHVLGKKRGRRAKWPASSAAVCATVVPQLLET